MLYFLFLQIREDGHYTCKVRKARTELKIKVKQKANKIRHSLKDVTATEEQPSAVFKCLLEKWVNFSAF